MQLIEALDIDKEQIIALVGAGGKTTSLFLLGKELVGQGRKVVLATTARMHEPQSGLGPVLLADCGEGVCQRVVAALQEADQILVGANLEDSKLTGISCLTLRAIAALPQVDIVVVEADGARGLPIKFPAPYEPVVCSTNTLVVPVLGMSALGTRVGDSMHRWQLACDYLGVEYGRRITPELVVQVLCHEKSYGKFLGKNRVIPLLNQVETRDLENTAMETARLLLTHRGIDRVIIGAVQRDQPVGAIIHRELRDEP